MIVRASGALMSAYLLLSAAGVYFILTPSPVLSQIAAYGAAVLIWGLFYLIGGVTAAVSLCLRRFLSNTTPLWFFEIAGLCLIIAANAVYAFALFKTGTYYEENNVIAASLVILAFSGGLVARVIETIRLVRTLKIYSSGGAKSSE